MTKSKSLPHEGGLHLKLLGSFRKLRQDPVHLLTKAGALKRWSYSASRSFRLDADGRRSETQIVETVWCRAEQHKVSSSKMPEGKTTNALSEFLFPLSKEEFFSNIGERRHHHFTQVGNPQRAAGFLDELNSFCSRNDIAYPAARMVHDGTAVPLDQYYGVALGDTRLLILDTGKAFDLLTNGYTLVVQCAHSNMRSVTAFSSELASELGCPLDLSIFVTPPFSVGLKAHYDTSSAFIFQVHGQKRWRLFAPYHVLPLAQSTFTFANYKETRLLADITLREGERLYIPRGVVHAPAAEDDLSIHLTVSLGLRTYADDVEATVASTPGITSIAADGTFPDRLKEIANPQEKTAG